MSVCVQFGEAGIGSVQVATNKGWADVADWADGLKNEAYPDLLAFIDHGICYDVDALIEDIDKAFEDERPEADIEDVLAGLRVACKRNGDQESVVVSDGFHDGFNGKELGDEVPARSAVDRDARAMAAPARMGKGKLHKASSAESILAHVLRQRGWTAQFKRGELTGKQHLSLLEDIRQYGRQWLRHEAEALFHRYGREDESRSVDARQSGLLALAGDRTARGIRDDAASDARFASPGEFGTPQRSTIGTSTQESRGLANRAKGAVSRFFDRSKQFVRELIVAGAMAIKGNGDLAADEVAMLNNQATIQSHYLDRFEREVTQNPPIEIAEPDLSTVYMVSPEPMTPGEFIARAESYGSSVYAGAMNVNREAVAKQAIANIERRLHLFPWPAPGVDPCFGCIDEIKKGWVPIGTLKKIGDCECKNNCHCWFEFQVAGSTKIIRTPADTNTGKPKLPKPTRPKDPSTPVAHTTEPPKPEPKPAKSDNYPPARPLKTQEQLIQEAGGPFEGVTYHAEEAE